MSLSSLTALLIAALPVAAIAAPLAYPPTATVPQTDTSFGVTVKDLYRWLEGDVRGIIVQTGFHLGGHGADPVFGGMVGT